MGLQQQQADIACESQFLGCLDKALESYGPRVSPVVYFYLEKEFGLKRVDIPRNVEVFSKMIDKFFGPGAHVVRTAIVHEMKRCSGIADLEKYDLAAALRETHHQFLRKMH